MMSFFAKILRIRGMALLAAVLALPACGSIIDTGIDKIPDNIYDLTPPAAALTNQKPAGKTIFLEPLVYPTYLDTVKITIKPDGQEIRYLADARWSDKAPDLISRFLALSLDQSGIVMVIDRDYPPLSPDYRMVADVRDFSAHVAEGSMPEIRVDIAIDLMTAKPLGVVARKGFSRSVPARANTREAIAAAFQEALEGIAGDLKVWVLEENSQ